MIDADENKTINMNIARYYKTVCLDHNQTTHSALECCDVVTTADTDTKQLTRHRHECHTIKPIDVCVTDTMRQSTTGVCDDDESWSGDTLRRRSTGLVRRATVAASRTSGFRSTAQHRRRRRCRARANDCSSRSARRRLAKATSTRCNVPITACTTSICSQPTLRCF